MTLITLCCPPHLINYARPSFLESLSAKLESTHVQAERIWEEAIAAKGGRERLYAIRSVAISSTGTYSTSLNKKGQIRQEELYVFPNKFWAWTDYRPDVFGLRVEMVDYDKHKHYIVAPDAPHDEGRGMPSQGSEQILLGQIYYLFETRWLKPVLVSATKGRVGSRPVDIVQTRVKENRMDFAFDRDSHLLVQLSAYHTRDNKEIFDNVINLSEYTDVQGLKVPKRITYEGGVDYEVSFQVNVAYDESIFTKPPVIEAGPDAWRAKK